MLQTSIFVQYNITGSQQSEGVGWCWMDIWVIFCKYYYRNAELCFQLFIIECSVPFQLFKCWNALVNYSSYLANGFALHCTPVSQEICTFSVNTYQRLLLILDQKYSYSETKMDETAHTTQKICSLYISESINLLAPQSGALRISAYGDFQSQSQPNPSTYSFRAFKPFYSDQKQCK